MEGAVVEGGLTATVSMVEYEGVARNRSENRLYSVSSADKGRIGSLCAGAQGVHGEGYAWQERRGERSRGPVVGESWRARGHAMIHDIDAKMTHE
jgi:hypothetical protein